MYKKNNIDKIEEEPLDPLFAPIGFHAIVSKSCCYCAFINNLKKCKEINTLPMSCISRFRPDKKNVSFKRIKK